MKRIVCWHSERFPRDVGVLLSRSHSFQKAITRVAYICILKVLFADASELSYSTCIATRTCVSVLKKINSKRKRRAGKDGERKQRLYPTSFPLLRFVGRRSYSHRKAIDSTLTQQRVPDVAINKDSPVLSAQFLFAVRLAPLSAAAGLPRIAKREREWSSGRPSAFGRLND